MSTGCWNVDRKKMTKRNGRGIGNGRGTGCWNRHRKMELVQENVMGTGIRNGFKKMESAHEN